MSSMSLSEPNGWVFLFVVRLLSLCSKTRFCLLHVRNLFWTICMLIKFDRNLTCVL